jgi:hypothetical protein
MLTPWGEKLRRDAVRPEYPRPQLVRDSFLSLNGVWDYAFTGGEEPPGEYEGEILVPFSPESALSGVGRAPEQGQRLWYRRSLTLPEGFNKGRVFLHFGAVDQVAVVYLNGQRLARHAGGYTAFSVEITDALGDENLLTVCVEDETEKAYHGRGKQRRRAGGVWHTAQSGIWQTVWCESVPKRYIDSLRLVPLYDEAALELTGEPGEGVEMGIECTAVIDGASWSFSSGEPFRIPLPGFEPWSPENPRLCELDVRLGEDAVHSYFAMRKISVEADAEGRLRLFLNNAPYFQNGVLTQGYWPDGLYTAPSDEALAFDIAAAKEMGFNMLRLHAKVECQRFYWHCDRLGLLVWQDLPNGGGRYGALATSPVWSRLKLRDKRHGLFGRRSLEGRAQFKREMRETAEQLRNHPCLALWVLFSEGRGQFDSENLARYLNELDGTRPIDRAGGWHDQGAGPFLSLHVYKKPYRHVPDKAGRAVLLSEFGGCGQRVDGHCFKKARCHILYNSPHSLEFALQRLYEEEIGPAAAAGLAACVYTQLTDVEEEQDGLITYDRRIWKLPSSSVRRLVRIKTR